MNQDNDGTLPESFKQAAEPRETVTVRLDSAALNWLKAVNPQNWQEELNGLLTFYHESRGFDPHAWEPGEMDQTPPRHAPEFSL